MREESEKGTGVIVRKMTRAYREKLAHAIPREGDAPEIEMENRIEEESPVEGENLIEEESVMEERTPFDGVHKLGFGALRLTRDETGKADRVLFSRMIDTYLDHGFCYFDTARPYMNGDNETAIRECLTSRYPRDAYILANKLSDNLFHTAQEISPLFESQLETCGVEYFDYYLLHGLNSQIYEKYSSLGCFEFVQEKIREGKVKHMGISFHDTADVLEKILTEHPEIEVVQIQLNYMDYYDSGVQSKKVYETCERFDKKVLVMEPCKGGHLARIPDVAQPYLDALWEKECQSRKADTEGSDMDVCAKKPSYASYALRFAAEHKNVVLVLSGMADMEMLYDNMETLLNPKPLTEEEHKAIDQVRDAYQALHAIPCTKCRYCVAGCPKKIMIPDLFACVNESRIFHNWQPGFYYFNMIDEGLTAAASDCIKCGKCEKACPQKLPIRDLLEVVVDEFETIKGPDDTTKRNRRSLR